MSEQEGRSATFYVEAFFWVVGLGAVVVWLAALLLVAAGVVGG